MEAFYYNRLDKLSQSAYYAMLSGIREMAPSFSVPLLGSEELAKVFALLRLDHPELFYSPSYKYRYYTGADSAEFIPDYLFDKKKIADHAAALRTRTTRVIKDAKGMSEQDKIKFVHDFVCTSVHYDKLKKAYSHEIIGPLGQGVGVCEGIAKTVKALCDELGIWCVVALCGNNPEKGIKYSHAWNVIKLNGRYYHLDATFDLSLSHDGEIRYDYFLLSDRQIFRDHESVIYSVPVCNDEDMFYYRQAKLSFTKEEDVRKRALQCAKKGKNLVFHWRGGYLTKEVLSQLLQLCEEEAVKKERHVRFSLNWPQAVIKLVFEKEIPAEQFILEEANEGEMINDTD